MHKPIPLPRRVELDPPPDDLESRVRALEVQVATLGEALSRHTARHAEEDQPR